MNQGNFREIAGLTAMKQGIQQKSVRDYMTRHGVPVHPGDAAGDSLKLMVENKVSALPVVDGRDRCAGGLQPSGWRMSSRDLSRSGRAYL